MKAKPFPALVSALVFCCAAGAVHGQQSELLPAEQAFVFNAVQSGDGRITAGWTIADGYYMYRDKMSFDITGQGRLTASAALPEGVTHRDSLFGEVEVYFSSFSADLSVAADGPDGYTLVAAGQGCNLPVGVCYPPMVRKVSLAPDSPATLAAAPADGLDTGRQLRALLGESFEQRQFLDVDDAFRLTIEVAEPDRLETAFTIADGYYLYRDKIRFSSEGGVRLAEVALPPGDIKNDAYFGEIAILQDDFSAPITLQRPGPAASEISVHATYQGCARDGICYSPVNKTFSLKLPAIISAASANDGALQPGSAPSAPAAFTAASLGTLLGAFLAGILLTFTPCVLPVLPILSAVIVGQGGAMTRGKAGGLVLAYVLGSTAAYAAIGALAGATGEQLQAYFQNIWAIGMLSVVLLTMALSMFGLFKLQTPSFIQAKWQHRARRLSGNPPLVFALGAVSAVIVGACVSPLLISFLGLAVSTGDPASGAAMMAAMALGMGVPLIALGLGAGYLLPRAGPWMQTVNHIFGVLLIAVAIYLMGVLPEVPVLLLWGVFFIIVSVYLGATQPTPAQAGGWRRLVKGAGLVLLIWGAAALIGGFSGQRDLLRPLPAGLFAGAADRQPAQPGQAPLFTRVSSVAELDRHLARAAADGQLVMLEYYADWCVDCTRMEKTTFRDPRVADILRRDFVALKVDVTDPRDAHGKALKKRFDVFGPPAVLFFDRHGAPLADKHFYGYLGSADFLALITSL
ncbi:MAG: protein-disulfide reductase DsbD [Gammaproteobacteria bacterium]|nr:protein-disulfide reductase DsbD [Gammaproteobacteria bacterium]